jgi:hypothetical protein
MAPSRVCAGRCASSGSPNLDELVTWLEERPQLRAVVERRFLATRERILSPRDPALLVDGAIRRERFWRVVDAVMGAPAADRRPAASVARGRGHP